MDKLLGQHVDLRKVRKIGEGGPAAAAAGLLLAALRPAPQPPAPPPPALAPPPLAPAGTFGEAFKAGGVVLKIVPMAGSILVNGEPQKRADEILAEVSVTLTLSRLNGAGAAPGAWAGMVGAWRGESRLAAMGPYRPAPMLEVMAGERSAHFVWCWRRPHPPLCCRRGA